jgi:riboflavin synthase
LFTGIVEEMGKLLEVKPTAKEYHMRFAANTVLEGTQLGDSIAVNGTCLTVTHFDSNSFMAGVAPETRKRTNLVDLNIGDPVNLERSVTPTTRLGGHFVQGHVDGVATLAEKRHDGEAIWCTLQADPELMRYIVPKGYVALDGTSLTVVDVWPDRFSIMLVPYTQKMIVLPNKSVGDHVNLEVDILGKYVAKLISGHLPEQKGITLEKLAETGFVQQKDSST